jgi:protein-S-isoprenylcysteine O-methyltransferase Ste14
MLSLAALGYVLARLWPQWRWDWSHATLFGAGVACIGVALNVSPKFGFIRARTTVNPLRPDAVSQLVTGGPYRVTRNPMYLGHALMLSGWAVALAHPLAFAAVPAYLLWIDRLQIPSEEAALAARFPQEFAAYAQRVRRWL